MRSSPRQVSDTESESADLESGGTSESEFEPDPSPDQSDPSDSASSQELASAFEPQKRGYTKVPSTAKKGDLEPPLKARKKEPKPLGRQGTRFPTSSLPIRTW
jgi:hypothetical protein